MEEYTVGQIFEGKYPPSAAVWCNSNGKTYITEIERGEDGQRRYQIVAVPEPTAEDLAEQALARAKAERAAAVSQIVVTVDGMQFDGDETSQERMARAVMVLADGETMPWVLYGNTIAQVTREQLQQALKLACEEQTALWTVPYQEESNG